MISLFLGVFFTFFVPILMSSQVYSTPKTTSKQLLLASYSSPPSNLFDCDTSIEKKTIAMKQIMKITFFFISPIVLSSCQTNLNPCSLSEETLLDISRLDSFINNPSLLEKNRQWMKSDFNEASIVDAKIETYQFLWNSSFNGSELYRI